MDWTPFKNLESVHPNSCLPRLQNVILIGGRDFADVMKIRWGHIRLAWVLIQWLVSLEKKRNNWRHRQTHWKESHVKTEARIQVSVRLSLWVCGILLWQPWKLIYTPIREQRLSNWEENIRFEYAAAAAAKLLQSCPTLRPHRRQPARLLRPWDSPGKNTGVGCLFLLQCMKVKSESEVTLPWSKFSLYFRIP